MDKIIQICPAPPDMWAEYKDDETGELFYFQVCCIALKEDEDGYTYAVFMDTSDSGEIDEISNENGLNRICSIGKRPESSQTAAEPVRHGRWEESKAPKMICCSVCGWGTSLEEKFFGYCPMCGARMDLGDDNEAE